MTFVLFQIYTYAGIVPFWIGVKDIDEDDNFVYASDGASLAFESWATNQPDNENHYCSQVCILKLFLTKGKRKFD